MNRHIHCYYSPVALVFIILKLRCYLCECETSCSTLREEHSLRVFVNSVEDYSPNIIRVIKIRRMRLVGHVN
jgi:hypothetical protein